MPQDEGTWGKNLGLYDRVPKNEGSASNLSDLRPLRKTLFTVIYSHMGLPHP